MTTTEPPIGNTKSKFVHIRDKDTGHYWREECAGMTAEKEKAHKYERTYAEDMFNWSSITCRLEMVPVMGEPSKIENPSIDDAEAKGALGVATPSPAKCSFCGQYPHHLKCINVPDAPSEISVDEAALAVVNAIYDGIRVNCQTKAKLQVAIGEILRPYLRTTEPDESLPYESQKSAYQAGYADGKEAKQKPVIGKEPIIDGYPLWSGLASAEQPVSLDKCVNALFGMQGIAIGTYLPTIAKAVLDAAGVKYVD